MKQGFRTKMMITAGLLLLYGFGALTGWSTRRIYDDSSKYWEAENLRNQLSKKYSGEDITSEKLMQIKEYPVMRDAEGEIMIIVNNGYLLKFLERTQSITIEPILSRAGSLKASQ